MTEKKKAGSPGSRVYSYVSDDGTVFWSLTKMRQTVSTGRRLVLQSRVGTPLLPFMVFMRNQALELSNEKEASVEDEPQLENNKTDERID